jgi:hypothetical protein
LSEPSVAESSEPEDIPPSSGHMVSFKGLLLPTPLYVLTLGIVFIIQWLWFPTWLISSRTGIQTVVQALPAALIALFALAFATLFVAVQQVTNVFSNRAPLILASDVRVRRIVRRTVLITASSLVLGSVIPDASNKPLPTYITASGTTLLVASALLIYSYGRFSYLLIVDYSAPRSFVDHVVSPVVDMIHKNKVQTGLVLFRVPLLGQTLRYALRRDDAETIYASLEGLQTLQKLYVEASVKQSRLRDHQLGENKVRKAWLADELWRIYVGVAEEALRLQAPQHEIDEIVDFFADAAYTFITACQEPESRQMMTGIARLATTPYQVMPNVTNYMTKPASALAVAESFAETAGQTSLASFALANWAVAIAYPQVHFGVSYHPLFREGVNFVGERPPWESAIELTRDPSWSIQWANQLQNQVEFTTYVLELARDLHEGPDGDNYKRRRKSVYVEWINVTSNVAAAMITNGSAFMQRLAAVNQNIYTFGSSEVQAAVQNYFNSYEAALRDFQANFASAPSAEPLQNLSAAFEQGAVVTARATVLNAMIRELGEELE